MKFREAFTVLTLFGLQIILFLGWNWLVFYFVFARIEGKKP